MSATYKDLVEKAVAILADHYNVQGSDSVGILTRIHELFDGPEYREACDNDPMQTIDDHIVNSERWGFIMKCFDETSVEYAAMIEAGHGAEDEDLNKENFERVVDKASAKVKANAASHSKR